MYKVFRGIGWAKATTPELLGQETTTTGLHGIGWARIGNQGASPQRNSHRDRLVLEEYTADAVVQVFLLRLPLASDRRYLDQWRIIVQRKCRIWTRLKTRSNHVV